MLEVENAFLTLGQKRILRGLNLEFEEGQIYGLLGPNGSGKSTLAYLLMGLNNYRLDKGKILLDDEDITELALKERAARGITLAWQEPARYEGLTIKDFLTLGGKYDQQKAGELLEFVGLSPEKYLEREVNESLSGGERKRVEMASVMMIKPRVVILDEPDSGIDYKSYEIVINAARYLREAGSIVILITHNIEIADYLDYAYLICNGLAYREGNPDKIKEFYMNRCNQCEYMEKEGEAVAYGL